MNGTVTLSHSDYSLQSCTILAKQANYPPTDEQDQCGCVLVVECSTTLVLGCMKLTQVGHITVTKPSVLTMIFSFVDNQVLICKSVCLSTDHGLLLCR